VRTPKPAREVVPKPDRKAERRQRARESLTRDPSVLAGDAVAYVFDQNAFYVRLANRAIEKTPWSRQVRYRGHGLCVCLNDLSKGLDPATYAKLAHTPIRAALLALGFPAFLAEVLSAGSAFGVKHILGSLPAAQLSKSLRAMIPLVCPNLDTCPARTDVVKTYASPALATELRTLAAGVH
jgi:hypothetical protein